MFTDYDREKQLKETDKFLNELEENYLTEFDDYPLSANLYEQKSTLQEMATPWREISKKLDNLRPIRHAHLIKLFYYKGQNHYAENFKGWVASTRKGFDDVQKTSETKKYPSYEKLYNLVWESVEDSFDDFHKRTVKDLNAKYKDFQKITNLKFDEVKSFCQAYNQWACKKISKDGGITYIDTEAKIKELLGLN